MCKHVTKTQNVQSNQNEQYITIPSKLRNLSWCSIILKVHVYREKTSMTGRKYKVASKQNFEALKTYLSFLTQS